MISTRLPACPQSKPLLSRRRQSTAGRSLAVLICALLLAGALPPAPLAAADDPLPAGRWVDRRTGVELLILRKNQLRLSHPEKSSALQVELQGERRVRREYWLAVKKITRARAKAAANSNKAAAPAKPSGPGESPWAIKPANSAQKPVGSAEKKPAAAPGPEIQLPWLTGDAKLILSYLIERPPPAPPKAKQKKQTRKAAPKPKPAAKAAAAEKQAAPGKAGETKQAAPKPAEKKVKPKAPARPRGPRPILEVLVFQKGALVFEGVFDPYRAPVKKR